MAALGGAGVADAAKGLFGYGVKFKVGYMCKFQFVFAYVASGKCFKFRRFGYGFFMVGVFFDFHLALCWVGCRLCLKCVKKPMHDLLGLVLVKGLK